MCVVSYSFILPCQLCCISAILDFHQRLKEKVVLLSCRARCAYFDCSSQVLSSQLGVSSLCWIQMDMLGRKSTSSWSAPKFATDAIKTIRLLFFIIMKYLVFVILLCEVWGKACEFLGARYSIKKPHSFYVLTDDTSARKFVMCIRWSSLGPLFS